MAMVTTRTIIIMYMIIAMQNNNEMLVNNGNVYKNVMLMLTTINECCLGLSLLSNKSFSSTY